MKTALLQSKVDLSTEDHERISTLMRRLITLPEAPRLFAELYEASLDLLKREGRKTGCFRDYTIFSGNCNSNNGYLGMSHHYSLGGEELELLLRQEGERVRLKLRREPGALLNSAIKKAGSMKAFTEQNFATGRAYIPLKEFTSLQPYSLLIKSDNKPKTIYY